ncbi:Ku protein [soil metagenome]
MAGASRVLWKGAISFGLVHIPVSLHSATTDSGIDFDWLDKRSMDPVGYKRINKKTGKEIDKANIVKGVAYEDGKYVVLSEEEIAAVYPRSTQSIDIESFVKASEIPFVYLDRPYYLAPIGKGQKVYALLRETLLKSQRIGLARVVIQTKQHLAALVPSGPALVLNLLRWGADIRSWEDLDLPAEGSKAAGLSERELAMATQLVDDMSAKWDPSQFRDLFKDEVMALVDKKVRAGQTETVFQPEADAPQGKSADIIDLTELLQRSLRGKGDKVEAKAEATAGKAPPAASKTKPAAAKKPASPAAKKRAA